MNTRIYGYDVARALAVMGMVIVNFKVVMGAAQSAPHWGLSLVSLLEGRAAATFVVLAGAGVSLSARKARMNQDAEALRANRQTLLKRALFLFVVGLLYSPIWPADILHFYGLYLTFGAFVLVAPSRRLWLLAMTFTLAFVALALVLDYETGWNWETLGYTGFWTPAGMVRHLFFNGFHPVFPWTAFLFIGMILGRQDLRDTQVRKRILWGGAGVALVAETTSRLLVRVLGAGAPPAEQELIGAMFGTAPMPPMPLYILAGAGTACAGIALCIALTERYRDAAWIRPLVSTGQLALTLYVAHVVIGMGALESLGRLEQQSVPFMLGSAAVFCSAAVLFAHLWRIRFKRGPLEWLMRRLT